MYTYSCIECSKTATVIVRTDFKCPTKIFVVLKHCTSLAKNLSNENISRITMYFKGKLDRYYCQFLH